MISKDYVWKYKDANGVWKPTNQGFKIIDGMFKSTITICHFDEMSSSLT